MMLCVSADTMQMNVNAHVNVVRAAAVCSEIEFVLSVCVYWRMSRETAFESFYRTDNYSTSTRSCSIQTRFWIIPSMWQKLYVNY